jgi:hypothetical protein
MSRCRYKLCTTCGENKSYDEFGLAATRNGRQVNCHSCVMKRLEKNGLLESYITGEGSFRKRTIKGFQKDLHYIQQRDAVKHKKLNDARRKYYADKKATSISLFKEMFPQTN